MALHPWPPLRPCPRLLAPPLWLRALETSSSSSSSSTAVSTRPGRKKFWRPSLAGGSEWQTPGVPMSSS
eukprot:15449349-Alexandrium_andersonii.AAC.1